MTHLQRVIKLDIAVYEYWLNRKFSKKKQRTKQKTKTKKKKKKQKTNKQKGDYSSSKKATVQSSFPEKTCSLTPEVRKPDY